MMLQSQRKNMKLMKSLMEQIKRDINNAKTIDDLKLFTEVNPMTIKRYEDRVKEFVDSVDSVLKRSMK